jgi:hypothetical protein
MPKKKTVKNPVIQARIEIVAQDKRRAKMTRRAPKPAGVDTAEVLNKQYALQKQLASRIAQTSQSQTVNVYLADYKELQQTAQQKRIDDDIESYRIKAQRGVSAEITAPAIAKLQQLRKNLPPPTREGLDLYSIPEEVEAPAPFEIEPAPVQRLRAGPEQPRSQVERAPELSQTGPIGGEEVRSRLIRMKRVPTIVATTQTTEPESISSEAEAPLQPFQIEPREFVELYPSEATGIYKVVHSKKVRESQLRKSAREAIEQAQATGAEIEAVATGPAKRGTSVVKLQAGISSARSRAPQEPDPILGGQVAQIEQAKTEAFSGSSSGSEYIGGGGPAQPVLRRSERTYSTDVSASDE